MANIPEKHRKYDLLPVIRDMDFDAFDYPARIRSELEKLLPKRESLIPYGYACVEAFVRHVVDLAKRYAKTEAQAELFRNYIEDIRRLNQKEYWSVLRYVGEEWDEPLRFTPGRAYYWPCDPDNPEFCGIIDDEEFTGYLYAPDPREWEILEDPTGMAYETMYGKDRDKWKWMYEVKQFKVRYTGETVIGGLTHGEIYEVKYIEDTLYCIRDDDNEDSLWHPDYFEIVEGSPDDVDEYETESIDDEKE